MTKTIVKTALKNPNVIPLRFFVAVTPAAKDVSKEPFEQAVVGLVERTLLLKMFSCAENGTTPRSKNPLKSSYPIPNS
jgi:hypothetical protein